MGIDEKMESIYMLTWMSSSSNVDSMNPLLGSSFMWHKCGANQTSLKMLRERGFVAQGLMWMIYRVHCPLRGHVPMLPASLPTQDKMVIMTTR